MECNRIKFAYLFHCILCYGEKKFIGLLKLNSYANHKIFFHHILYELRILLGRLLVAYRWSSANASFSIDNEKAKVLDFSNQLSNIYNFLYDNWITPFNKEIKVDMDKLFSLQKSPKKPQFNILSLNSPQMGHIKKIIETKKSFVFVAPSLYSITIIKKYNSYDLSQLIFSDTNKYLKENDVKNIAFLLQDKILRQREPLELDNFLFSIYLTLSLVQVIEKIKPFLSAYQCQLEYKDLKIYLIFPNSFYPFNYFILEKIKQHIQLRSTTPLYFPPKNSPNISEKFSKIFHFIEPPPSIREMFYAILDPVNLNCEYLLSTVHKLLFYSKVQNFWLTLKGNMRASMFTRFGLYLKNDGVSVYNLYIELNDESVTFLKVTFDMITAEHRFIFLSESFYVAPPNVDIAILFWSVACSYYDFMNLSALFRNQFYILKTPFFISLVSQWKLYFSFSESFFIETTDGLNGIALHLRSPYYKGNSFNPNSFILESLMRKIDIPSFKMDRVIDDLLISSKLHVILMELEWKLSEGGFFCKRDINMLRIPSAYCKFKITENDYWVLKFEKVDFPFLHAGVLRIDGHTIGIRFIDSIFNLIQNVFIVSSMAFQTRHQSLLSSDNYNIRQIGEFKMYIMLTNIYENYSNNGFNYFETTSFSEPSVECVLLKKLTLFKMTSIDFLDDFGGFIKSGFDPSLRICDTFDSDSWRLIPYPNYDKFFIIYKNKYILTVRKISGVTFSIHLPITGMSSFLTVPLLKVTQPQLVKKTKINTLNFCVSVTEFAAIRDSIESYNIIIDALNFMKIDIFEYVNGRVEGKGTRFFLSKVFIDKNGMTLSSASFPSLHVTTSSIQVLSDISFHEKSVLLYFIIQMITLDDTCIINLLKFVKLLLECKFLKWNIMINKWKIDSTNKIFDIVIVENNSEAFFYFHDLANKAVRIDIQGLQKSMNLNQFLLKYFSVIDMNKPIIDQLYNELIK